MRLGLCCTPEEGPAALAAGYDYVEYPAASTEPSEATNAFYPPGVSAYGPSPLVAAPVALELGREIIDAAVARGVQVMVLGSGAARRAPEGLPVWMWSRSFYALAKALDAYAQDRGIRVAPESLNSGETNVGTELPELAHELNARGTGYTADSYHALVEAGNPDVGLAFWRGQVPFAPLHVHFAPYDRSVPTGREASLRAFFARLRELGYDGRASLECRRDGIPDPAALRRLFG